MGKRPEQTLSNEGTQVANKHLKETPSSTSHRIKAKNSEQMSLTRVGITRAQSTRAARAGQGAGLQELPAAGQDTAAWPLEKRAGLFLQNQTGSQPRTQCGPLVFAQCS